jgi:hypothetical protein
VDAETKPPEKKFKNPHRISVADWRKSEELESEDAYLEAIKGYVMDSVCPAMCDEGCEVEPDGKCPHGCPSILLAIGMI